MSLGANGRDAKPLSPVLDTLKCSVPLVDVGSDTVIVDVPFAEIGMSGGAITPLVSDNGFEKTNVFPNRPYSHLM